VYMQTEDPATTGQPMQAGAIWIKPKGARNGPCTD
jgi:hypothetical protein